MRSNYPSIKHSVPVNQIVRWYVNIRSSRPSPAAATSTSPSPS